MTVKELKDFIEGCNDTDYVTICISCDDNPITEYCDVGTAFKINVFNEDMAQICLMPS